MPKGAPKPQTIATAKYQKKAGYKTKGFKIKGDVDIRFAEACAKAGISQSAQLVRMMEAFIAEVQKGGITEQ